MDKNSTIVIFYTEKEVKKFLDNPFNVDYIFPLSPDALAKLDKNIDYKIIDINKKVTDYTHRKIVAKTRLIEKKLIPIIEINNNLSEAGKETFINFFHTLYTKYLYLQYVLKFDNNIFYYKKNKWNKSNDFSFYFPIIFEKILNEKKYVYGKGINQIDNIKYFKQIVNFITISFLRNKKNTWVTGVNGGLSRIIRSLINSKNDFKFISLEEGNNISLLKIIKIFVNLINPLKKNKIYSIVPVRKFNNYTKKTIYEIFQKLNNKDLEKNGKPLIELIFKAVNYTESIIEYTDKILKKTQPKLLIAHQLRWFESTVLGNIAKINNIPVYLISHGSHPKPFNTTSEYELKSVSRGLLVSRFASKTIVQSPQASDFAKKEMPNLTQEFYQPIMWGKYNKDNFNKLSKKKFTIIHAGTYKVLAGRPWIYETSNEFVKGLKELITVIDKLKNIELILRIRENDECSIHNLKKILPKSKNLLIKSDGSFIDDLNNSHMLISFSSTTIEEALNLKKVVGTFGGTNRYNHFNGSDIPPDEGKRFAIYNINSNNLKNMIKAISVYHLDSDLSEKEIDNLVWNKKIPNFEKFIYDIIKVIKSD